MKVGIVQVAINLFVAPSFFILEQVIDFMYRTSTSRTYSSEITGGLRNKKKDWGYCYPQNHIYLSNDALSFALSVFNCSIH